MPDTFVKIATVTVGSGGAATMAFSSIPSTYTDLKLCLSTRSTGNAGGINLTFNGDTANNYNSRRLYGNGSNAYSATYSTQPAIYLWDETPSTNTANTFSSIDVYVPNYAGSTSKSVSSDGVSENNATNTNMSMVAGLWSGTSAITAITLVDGGANFAQYSTATLYGISKS
jgi:hypothetical protein